MLKKEIYKLANHKLLEELRVDVGKIQLKNDLLHQHFSQMNFLLKPLSLTEKISSYVENLSL